MELAPAQHPTDSNSLRVGFVALIDAAPVIVALELGLFEQHGLNVVLQRQPGWGSVRDKIATGELHASQAVSGLPFALSLGLGGVRCECLTGLLLNTHGDAITVSNRVWETGGRSLDDLGSEIRRGAFDRPLVFGVVHPYSTHNFLLRGWVRSAGLVPDRDIQIVNVPPALMARNLAARNLDGFCVGEPWNTAAICEGIGHCIATSAELRPYHPEKNLLVTKTFAERRSAEHLALISAVLEACAFCDSAANIDETARILAKPGYINLPVETIQKSLRCEHIETPQTKAGKLRLHQFGAEPVNRPNSQAAAWILEQMNLCGLGVTTKTRGLPGPADVFRTDIYDDAVAHRTAVAL